MSAENIWVIYWVCLKWTTDPVDMPPERVTTTRMNQGREEVVIYERADGDKIKILDQHALEKRREMVEEKPKNVIVPLKRKSFIQATGASETELLG